MFNLIESIESIGVDAALLCDCLELILYQFEFTIRDRSSEKEEMISS